MAMYGIAILPLIQRVRHENITHKWYADDGNAVGKLEDLAAVFQRLKTHGPSFGYHLTKCQLIVKECLE